MSRVEDVGFGQGVVHGHRRQSVLVCAEPRVVMGVAVRVVVIDDVV